MSQPKPRAAKAAEAESDPRAGSVGSRLRTERERQRIGLREFARRVNVSASLISQIELGRATPSVGTLYAIVNELNMSLDELFFDGEAGARARPAAVAPAAPVAHTEASTDAALAPEPGRPRVVRATSGGPVVRAADRQSIHLGSGVTWERMSPDTEHGVDFLYVVYEVGGASAPERSLIRHGGREYGHLLSGRLAVTVGFETYELEPGDAISFDSTMPHRLFNIGDTTATAIWCVVGRDDPRFTRASLAADAADQ